MIVVDASILVELLRGTAEGRGLQRWIADPEQTLHAPHLVDLEVASAVRRLRQRDLLSEAAASAALEALRDIDMYRYPHTDLLPRVWSLRENVSPYDSAYLALAEVLRAPLVTRDARLRDVPGCVAAVEVI